MALHKARSDRSKAYWAAHPELRERAAERMKLTQRSKLRGRAGVKARAAPPRIEAGPEAEPKQSEPGKVGGVAPPGGTGPTPDRTPETPERLPAPGSVTVSSEHPLVPPSQMLPPPGGAVPTGPPTPPKESWWKPMPPTPEEFKSLTDAFVRLELRGFDAVAAWTEWDGWKHSEEEMEPDRVIWRYVLRRIKYDPGLLMVALSVIEIAEREGKRGGEYRAVVKARKKPAPNEGGGTPEIVE